MDKKIIDAVRSYRATRESQTTKQAGSGKHDQGARGAVTGGAQMDAFADLISAAITETGIPESEIFTKTAVELPGYYRPEKKWDIVVVHNGVLGAVIEMKYQMGPSFGNNFNNRTEEAIGSATDIWVAYREKRFGGHMFRPWLGYLFLLEDCAESIAPVAVREPHFPIDDIFRGASYKKRYEILCERLILERLYESSCFMTARFSDADVFVDEPNANLSFEHFAASLKGHMQVLKSRF
ncbi:MAG: PaeR7I family type II restriction endonuclease [Methanoregula sp.]|jgi:hypothetical protein